MDWVERKGKSECKGEDCDATIVWVEDEEGTRIPFDAKLVQMLSRSVLGKQYLTKGHIPHHVTCPNRDDF